MLMRSPAIRRTLPILLALLLGGPVGPARAQDGIWGGALVSKIDSLAEGTLADGPVASLAIGVKRGSDLLLVRGYGLADLELGARATAETVYRIGSVTKQFTAAAVMQLVEAGKIGLDDPMTKYLPDYPTQGHTVTIRHLLTHTSGIKSYTSLEGWRSTLTLERTDDELVALFKDESVDFAPGEEWLYNNSGFYLLGMIIERASGETYREYLGAHLFEALGLGGSSYCDERPIIRNRAEGYEQDDGKLVNDAPLSMNQPGAAGALCSTVPDLLNWESALRGGQVVSADSYVQMTTPYELTDGSSTGYGFGLGVGDLEGHPRVSHGGGINGFVTMLSYFPESDLTIVVLSNTGGGHAGRVARTIAMWALGIPIPTVSDEPLSAEERATYEGSYQIEGGPEITVYSDEGVLFAKVGEQSAFRLRAQGNHVFIPTFDDTVRMEFTLENGGATELVLHQGGVSTVAKRAG